MRVWVDRSNVEVITGSRTPRRTSSADVPALFSPGGRISRPCAGRPTPPCVEDERAWIRAIPVRAERRGWRHGCGTAAREVQPAPESNAVEIESWVGFQRHGLESRKPVSFRSMEHAETLPCMNSLEKPSGEFPEKRGVLTSSPRHRFAGEASRDASEAGLTAGKTRKDRGSHSKPSPTRHTTSTGQNASNTRTLSGLSAKRDAPCVLQPVIHTCICVRICNVCMCTL